jgi:hypothetical protein
MIRASAQIGGESMTTLAEQIETMRVSMHDVAHKEERLVRSLGETLNSVDEKLLDRVRTVTVEHGARRSLILHELQMLASRMGAFPQTKNDHAILEDHAAESDFFDIPAPSRPFIARGDWRVAASNIREQEEHMNGHATGR